MPVPLVIIGGVAIYEGTVLAAGAAVTASAAIGMWWYGGGQKATEQAVSSIANSMSSANEQADTQLLGGSLADTCATGNCPPPGGGCNFDKYGDLECEGGQKKHHIIADYVIRAGKRMDTGLRLPNAPSLNDGPSICLSDTEHSSVHRQMDAAVANLGPEATLGQVKDIAMQAIEDVKPECKGKMNDIKSKINEAFEKMGDDAPVRHQKSPLPKGSLLDRLFGRGVDSGLR